MAKAKKPKLAQQRARKLTELKELIRQRLERFWPRRIPMLKKWVEEPPAPGVTHLRFEIHDACTTLTICLYAVGADDIEHLGNFMSDLVFPRYDSIPWETYRRAIGRKAEPIIEEVLIEELRRLWLEVGGANYPIPVVIRWHDSSPAYHLLTGKVAPLRYR